MAQMRVIPKYLCGSTVPLAGAACALILAASAHADTSCDAGYDAGFQQMQTPHHIVTSRSARGGKGATTSETIFAGGVIYMPLGGQWQRSPTTGVEMLVRGQEKRNAASRDETCHPLGDDAVGGAGAAVDSLHNDVGTDSKLWVSKTNGLLLRRAITLPDGSSIVSRYDYANVEAPPGAR